MEEDFGFGAFLDEGYEFGMKRFQELAVHARRDQQPILHTEIVTDLYDIDIVTQRLSENSPCVILHKIKDPSAAMPGQNPDQLTCSSGTYPFPAWHEPAQRGISSQGVAMMAY